MFLFFALPFVAAIITIIIITTALRSAEQKKRADAQRMPQAPQTAAPVEGQASYTPVRASVQVPPVREAAAASTSAYGKQIHPQHDDCALRPDQKVQQPPVKHPQHDQCSLREDALPAHGAQKTATPETAQYSVGDLLNFTPDNILRGVVFAEVFGKPKALR